MGFTTQCQSFSVSDEAAFPEYLLRQTFLFFSIVLWFWENSVSPCLSAPSVTPSPTKMLVTPILETCLNTKRINHIKQTRCKSSRKHGQKKSSFIFINWFNVSVLIIEEEHVSKRHPCPCVYLLKMLRLVSPTRKYFLGDEQGLNIQFVNESVGNIWSGRSGSNRHLNSFLFQTTHYTLCLWVQRRHFAFRTTFTVCKGNKTKQNKLCDPNKTKPYPKFNNSRLKYSFSDSDKNSIPKLLCRRLICFEFDESNWRIREEGYQ